MDVPYEEIHKKWQAKFERNELTSRDLRNFWKYYVPEIFSPEPECDCLKISYKEDLAQSVLFDTLERFLYGEDPSKVFQMIQDLDNPPSLCGRVFKTGDPTYGCRDCGMDPTCVLCAECFQNSAHNKHRYKISTSSGGGYCDCGDKEAWKSSVFCNIHVKGENSQFQSQNILEKLPTMLVEKLHFVFDTVLQYAKQMLTHEDSYSLPSDLEIRDWEREPTAKSKSLFELKDAYVTMLYNDETHTYDQVIEALMRAVDCSKRESFTYATSIDREGRCIVRCSTFQQCSKAKDLMGRPTNRSISRPLKVQVIHTFIISHQVFASRLLNWLHNILKTAQTFRLIFKDIVTKDECSLIESIFRSDTLMWKTARIQWHRLFISGMLMEIESKKIFARVFTKHYDKMMKDFIQDDHEHSVCVVSLAVQLFTMPTIAHMLIAEEDVLVRLLNTFLSECRKNLKHGKLYLESKSRDINTFKRIQYILYDFKYLLGFKPEIWTTELRKGFLHGFDKLLNLLSMMQGMDPMVRQVWQHMEFEPEWESAFNLHLKLSTIVPLVVEWAASDLVVLIKSYRMLLKALGEQTTEDMRRRYVRELLHYSVSCIEYDVSSAPVSLHLPLSRLVAGLTLKLEKYGLNYNSVEFSVKGKPSPEELMEPVLRTQVMIAQASSGMWRRNGFSLTNQIYYYHNVRCRQEMLDRDIVLLQEAATLIDANEFLIHLLNRFNLINWARKDYEINYMKSSDEDNLRQTVALAEEFLTLVLHLVSERYTVGVGCVNEEDCIKKEIIQLLCIEPMPHSVLNKALPEGVNHETGMEKVIDSVALFKKPSGEGKGYFELKKEFYSEYNFFFYHYTKEEQSKSEVAQRNRKKTSGEDICCPPPIPPKFTDSFTLLVNILQCDVFLHLVLIILQRIGETKSQSVTESHLQIVLHLIGYALHEEERYIKMKDPYFRFTSKAQNYYILPLLEFLTGSSRAITHKDILKWTINRYHEVERLSASEPAKHRQKTSESNSSNSSSSLGSTSASAEKKRKADMAAERKARIMSKMANLQKNFILKNESLFKETPDVDNTPADMPSSLMDTSPLPPENMIAVGPNQTLSSHKDNIYTCILCHQDDSALPSSSNETGNMRAMVLGALVQRSTVLSKNGLSIGHLLSPDTHDTLLLSLDLHWGAHISSCGHAMHAKCWQRYFDDVLCRERRKPHRTRQIMSFDIEKNEYLCPLCESLCNTALPLLPTVTSNIRQNNVPIPQEAQICTDFWVRALEHTIKERVSAKENSKESSPEKKEKGAEKDEDSINISESAVLKALSTLLKSIEEEPAQNSNHQKLVEHLKKQVWFATSNFKEFYLFKNFG
ncbi:E3 ubiquitin-protein ligase UBR2 [Armadillidium nasatum]|uniref:E3 ubiquitin-protein ligase n=1 Tax=Armadillidium nasatum TaxID=96803 RepID=A0A5N5T7M9_9CRUS|nr:E3 ubiquitin-protein ligase UBR2 [Armadillidium nasatum]